MDNEQKVLVDETEKKENKDNYKISRVHAHEFKENELNDMVRRLTYWFILLTQGGESCQT